MSIPGHTLVFEDTTNPRPILSVAIQGEEEQDYFLQEVHFHRGNEKTANKGSEHSIDGDFFVLEVSLKSQESELILNFIRMTS